MEMRRLASVVSWAKNARINSSGYLPAQWVIGRMSWLRAAKRAFETMDTSHRVRRALFSGVRASSHTQGIVTGELVFLKKPNAKLEKGLRGFRAIALMSVLKEPIEWRGLHVGPEREVNCEPVQALLTNILQRHYPFETNGYQGSSGTRMRLWPVWM